MGQYKDVPAHTHTHGHTTLRNKTHTTETPFCLFTIPNHIVPQSQAPRFTTA